MTHAFFDFDRLTGKAGAIDAAETLARELRLKGLTAEVSVKSWCAVVRWEEAEAAE